MSTSDNINHNTLLDAHLQSLLETLHTMQQARKQDTLQPGAMRQAVQQVYSNIARDFPPEQSLAVTESSVQDLLDNYMQRVQKRATAAPTGLRLVDTALNGGFQAKRLVTLLGAPGGGKTSLANQWADQVARERPVFYVTSEDTPDVLIAKTLSRVGNVDYGDVLYGRDEAGIKHAIEMVARQQSNGLLRYLDVSAGMITLDELRSRASAHFEGKKGPGLIVIDYLQRMARAIRDSVGVKELREAVTQLTERLRAIACELDCTVLAIASMNRASGYGKSSEANSISSAKESGDIEYTADIMMALTEDPKAEMCSVSTTVVPRVLRIDKNRQGPVATIKLMWRADRQKFAPVADEEVC